MTRFDLLKAQWPEHRISPAECLDLITGQDAEGWSVYLTVRVGDVVHFGTGKAYRVAGFTRGNTVLAYPHGLNHDPAATGYELESRGMMHLPMYEEAPVVRHSAGLVAFA